MARLDDDPSKAASCPPYERYNMLQGPVHSGQQEQLGERLQNAELGQTVQNCAMKWCSE